MAITVYSSAPWHVAIGSVEETVSYMSTGSVNPVSLKAMLQDIPVAGSVSVVYFR